MAASVSILFDRPEIPQNTGSTIRLAALTGCELHVAGPLGFRTDDTQLKRAGLDYHDLASFTVHDDLEAAYATLMPARVFAFTARGVIDHTQIAYAPGDVLLFGSESSGLSDRVLGDDRVTARVRIPMLPGRRSLNLASAAAVVVYEAWRQLGFTDSG